MWLVFCVRGGGGGGILTKVSAPDPKGKLNISSFHTLSQLLDCLFFTRNCMPRNCMCCYLNDAGGTGGGGGGGGGGWLLSGCSWVDRWWVLSYSCWGFFYLCFCLLFSLVLCLFCYQGMAAVVSIALFIFCFLCLRSLIRSYWCMENVVSVMDNYS